MQFNNFLAGTALEQCLKYRQINKDGTSSATKIVEIDTFVQFKEAYNLLNDANMDREDIYEFIELLTNDIKIFKKR